MKGPSIPAPPANAHPKPEASFNTELIHAITPLRSSLNQLLVELGSPSTATALNKLSGAGNTLCWQIYRIVHAEDLAMEARHAPSPIALKRLLVAAERHRVRRGTITSIERAAEEFQRFAKTHVHDRASFDSLVAGAADADDKILLTHRRAAYRANSHMWGVQTDLLHFTYFVRAAQSGEGTDEIMMYQQRGIRRLRPGVNIILWGYHNNPSQSSTVKGSQKPLDSAAAAEFGVPLLPEFCTQPISNIEKVILPSGWTSHNLVGDSVGLRSNFDCTFAMHNTGMPFMTDSQGRQLFYASFNHIKKPCALFVFDLLIHRPSLPKVRPQLLVSQYHEGDHSIEAAQQSLSFPVEDKLTTLGRATDLDLPETPGYNDLLHYAARKVDWDLSEFEVFRVRMPFPILGSSVRQYFYVS